MKQPGDVVPLFGMPGRGKTTLALEFAHRYYTDFESIYWLPCQSRDIVVFTADLQRQLDLKIEGGINDVVTELKNVLARKRCLLILDNVEEESAGRLIPGGSCSVLITTRQRDLRFLRLQSSLELPLFTEDQCFDLFSRVLGTEEVSRYGNDCRRLFERLGYLPIGVSVAAGLIQSDVRYTIAGLTANLPADVTELISEAVNALDADARTLLTAMSACAPEGFRLALAANLVDLSEPVSLNALQQLASRSLVEEIDRGQRRYRLHSLVREAAQGGELLARRHVETVAKRFEAWETEWRTCEQDLADFQLALSWVLANTEHLPGDFADRLAYNGVSFSWRTGHNLEAFEICEQWLSSAEQRNDKASLQAWYGNQALILRAWGRLEEALALLQKQEAICLELGNKDGLGRSYGNQALILTAWGRLKEALALHKKEEAICVELGNKDGLGTSYGNQALILRTWGRLEEALALLRKQEAICLELGNKDGLQRTYGNQALILQDWGRLEEALPLHKKQEAICLELENKDSLQASYGNQALILQDWGRLEEALALHKKQEAICLELGNKDGLQTSYGNQALILRAWGRLKEALALHKQEEAICLELGNKSSLGYCYWNWGLLARDLNDPPTEHEKLSEALAIFTELKMPHERDAVAAELSKISAGA